MATVLLARDIRHERRVAVKVLDPEVAAVIGRERFLSEIRIAANLQHPNLLPLFDSGDADGLLYYVMPYVAGDSLRARLSREKQLPVDDAVHIATVVASALDHAHRHDVIHRDLKPENILLHDGEPTIADFGIALAISNAVGNRLTQTGLSLGTPQYMSPEQAAGERNLDRRTDIYALGAVLYEMLTGEPPHSGATAQAIIAKVVSEPVRSVRTTRESVPPHVDAVICRALAKVPADRWPTAQAFGTALNSPGPRTGETATKPPLRARTFSVTALQAAGALLIVAALAALGVASAWRPWSRAPATSYAFIATLPDSAAVAMGGGNGAEISISRDGKTIAYVAGPISGGDVRRGIWTRDLDDLVAHPVSGLERGTAPRFSPDGAMLMYAQNDALYAIALTGGRAIRIVPEAGSADWIDSQSIVYTHGSEMWGPSRRGSELWTTNIHNIAPRPLVVPDTARGILGVMLPSVLPGGKAALVSIWKREQGNLQREIAIASLEDGSITELGVVGSSARYALGQMLFAKDDGALYDVALSPSQGRISGRIVQVVPQVALNIQGRAGYDISASGTLTYVAGTESRRRIVLIDRTGRASALGSDVRRFFTPRVSPDGRIIAVEVGSLEGFDIWTYDRGSATLSAVTSDHRSIRPGGWANDGADVLYLHIDSASRKWDVSMQRSDGRIARQEVIASDMNPQEVSVGGGALAFRRGNREVRITAIDAPAQSRLLLPASARAGVSSLSLDGRYIAYESDVSGNDEIYAQLASAGSARVQISSNGGIEPAWSPRGDEIFYRGSTHLISAKIALDPLRVVRRDTLFRDDFIRGGGSSNYAVSPDGQQFIMVQNEESRPYPTVLVN